MVRMTAMRLYADSANTAAVGSLLRDGVVAGVTTNPTILAKSGRVGADIRALHAEWLALGAEELFFQAWGQTTEELVTTGRAIAALGERTVVKVPASAIGLPAAAQLARSGVPVLVTAVYGPAQAIAASAVGARYIAPYLGRLEDAGRRGVDDIAAMDAVLRDTGTSVLVASLRSPAAIVALAEAGLRYFTAAPTVLRALFSTPASDAAIADFDAAAAGWTL